MGRDRDELNSAVVDETLRNLIRQFSQELCFYRELIQNALDAGSRRIDVRVEFEEARSMAVAHVIDVGEGMDRKTIDEQLTRLFSSTKEDDQQKIGKFGIGFVSVFAIEPEAVVVDTGKNGEYWRVLFRPGGDFDRLVLDEPVEGTHVKVYKKMSAAEFPQFRLRSRDTVKYWCRHADSAIFFDDEPINEPLDLEAPIKVHCTRQGTEIVAAVSNSKTPFFGFYNGGITLLEGGKEYLAHTSFKIKSRFLEHTLSRDNVTQDQNFGKVMHLLEHVAQVELPQEMYRVLRTCAEAADAAVYERTMRLCKDCLQAEWGDSGQTPQHPNVPFLRILHGRPLSFTDLQQLHGKTSTLLQRLGVKTPGPILFETAISPLTEQLAKFGIAVLEQSEVALKLVRLHFPLARASEVLACLQPALAGLPTDAMRSLCTAATTLLGRCGMAFREPAFAIFEPPLDQRLFVNQPQPGPLALVSQPPISTLESGWLSGLLGQRPCLVVNVKHSLLRRLADGFAAQPKLSTYLLAKAVCLDRGINPETDSRLLAASLA